MPGQLEGKTALITGAARGQGRSHAVRLAQEGANIIALDICRQIESVAYPMGTADDLRQTTAAVENLGRSIVAREVDVRDLSALRTAVSEGIAELGSVDIVLANAGIGMMSPDIDDARAFRDQMEVNLFGVWNTVQAAAPAMIEQGTGGAIVLTGSTLGLVGRGGDGTGGSDGYCASKHAIVGLGRTWSHWLAPHNIRVNSVHPTGANYTDGRQRRGREAVCGLPDIERSRRGQPLECRVDRSCRRQQRDSLAGFGSGSIRHRYRVAGRRRVHGQIDAGYTGRVAVDQSTVGAHCTPLMCPPPSTKRVLPVT